MSKNFLIFSCTVLVIFSGVAYGATYTVTNTFDGWPVPPIASLRWAIQSANGNPGPDTINFNIAGAGPHTIVPAIVPLDTIREAVYIDGYTQPGAVPNTQPQGVPTDAVLKIEVSGLNSPLPPMGWDGFHIHSNDVVIRGLCVNCFWNGIVICSGSQDCRVIGCYIGTDIFGDEEFPCTTSTGVRIQHASHHNWVGGPSWADRNVISCYDFGQVDITDLYSDSNVVVGNYIGTEKNGMTQPMWFDNNGNGVSIYEGESGSPRFNRVGDQGDSLRNVISGNGWEGIEIAGPGKLYNVVENNYIGVNAVAAPLGNGFDGVILMDCTKNNTIGPDNVIAHNFEDGVEVIHGFCEPWDDTDFNTITQNSIYDNVELGIDLGPMVEVTPNDPADPDTGQNQELNFPVITSASYNGGTGQTTIMGTLDIDTPPNLATIEVFEADADPTGHGEGRTYLGSTSPDGVGNWSIVVAGLLPGDSVTATTTDVDSNTSEFDSCDVVSELEEDFDFGDAPDPTYPTLLASNGARHLVVPGISLGALIDPEGDGQPSADALGDDNFDGIDDEDGVVFTSLVNPGGTVNVKVTASVGGLLDAWVDFNIDGDWTDPGEQIFASQALVAGANFLAFGVPAGATTGTTYSRFRFNTTAVLADTGLAYDGEVEDYRVFIQDPIQDSKMHWPQWPDLDSTGMDVDMHVGPLADDWMCIETGWVKDIHFWASFADDILPAGGPGSLVFQMTIYNDIPTPPSHPGDTLWTAIFDVGQYDVHLKTDNNPEDWYDPWTGFWDDDNHLQAYQYDFYLQEADWFWQEEGVVYWLEIRDVTPPTDYTFGWKTTTYDLRYRDDAVYFAPPWTPMVYPDPHEYASQTLDLAFVITGEPEIEELDFGDAPDPTYPTLLASNGARHVIVPGIFLGATIDPEADGQPAADALGDDNGGNDDEDGVVFTSLVNPGGSVNVKVIASVPGILDAWVDFNIDGDWADLGEQIFVSQALGAGANFLAFAVPGGATIGTTYSRFRFSTAGGLPDTGLAVDGEVEDYRVFIQDPIQDSKMHWEQWPDLDSTGMDVDMFRGPLADDWMCTETGWVKDIHFWGSFADDILPPGGPGSLVFQLTIYNDIPTPPSHPGDTLWTAIFDVGEYDVHLKTDNNPEDWYDPWTGFWDDDNHLQAYQYDFFLQETDWFWQEQDSVYWLEIRDVTPPTSYTFGWKTTTYDLRYRDDAVYLLPPWTPMFYPPGHEYDSETLDLAFVITGEPEVQELDFGDAPDPTYPTLLTTNGARHTIVPGIFLGAMVDAEADGQPAADALGDDNLDGIDDEDGVVFTSLVNPGGTVNVKVTASVGGLLDAWVDFNIDGDWADAGEQIFASQALVAGANFLAFGVPAGATTGTSYSRFRFNTTAVLADTGLAFDGEVEDYRVFIQDPVEDSKMHWEQWPDLDSTGMDVDMHLGPLADDWMCTETGWVKDIHFWGSYANDILPAGGPGSLVFQLTIYDDIPTPPSHPGDTLWTAVFGPGDYEVHLKEDNNPEDWYDPWTGVWLDDNHLQVYQYDFFLEETDWFAQELDVVYWLEIRDVTPPTDYTFGWKTTTYDLRYRDDAVYLLPPWTPMFYPPGHEYASETLDLAFVITGEEDCPCGDCNGDGRITVADATYIVGYIYRGGPPPCNPPVGYLPYTDDRAAVALSSPRVENQVVEISVNAEFEVAVAGLHLLATYDHRMLKPLMPELTPRTEGLDLFCEPGLERGRLKLGMLSLTGEHFIEPGDAAVLTLRFEGLEGAVDYSSVRIEEVILVDEQSRELATALQGYVLPEVLPTVFSLSQNYPNPLVSGTDISYALPRDVEVTVEVFNLLGEKVRTLVNRRETAGHKFVHWDGTNVSGDMVAPGIYFYRITANGFVETKKMVVTR